MTRRLHCLLPVALLLVSTVQAAEPLPDSPATVLDTVVVSGRQPGPGLWKVSKDGHVMFLLGTVSPLPKRMEWASEEVESLIADSDELLLSPAVTLRVENAALGGLFLIPSVLKARNNPDGKKLVDVLPAEDYADWTRLKQRYIGRDRGVEKRRPMMAASQLQAEALDDEDLSSADVVEKKARKAAKRHDVTITEPTIELVVEDPKVAVKEFAQTSLADLDCFRRTLQRVDRDIENLKLRANAWALGEIAILQSLTTTDTFRACTDAVFETTFARNRGLDKLEERSAAAWMEAAEKALDTNETTFGVLPISLMLRGGYLAQLEARGYRIEAPDAEPSEAEEAAATGAVEAMPATQDEPPRPVANH